jgi:rubrerythrin
MDSAYCDALRMAYEFEREGMKHYRDASERVHDEFAKRALVFLAEEEERHLEKIDRFNAFLLGRGSFDLETECSIDSASRIHDFVSGIVRKSTLSPAELESDLAVYEEAMEVERQGYIMYRKAAETETDERVKTFLTFLMDEETRHYDLLMNTRRYLEDPSYYFEDAGGWIFS